jgi:hypothetical protein
MSAFSITANHKLAAGTKIDKASFTCGVVPDSLGMNVTIPIKEKVSGTIFVSIHTLQHICILFQQIKRPKKDSVLVKHKKWLADLQRTKEQLEEAYIQEMKAKEEAQAKVSDYILITSPIAYMKFLGIVH